MRYAISDIHGHCETFLSLLDRIQLSPSDELYLLGDYVDRGPDSCGVIETILDLEADGYQVHCLKGNHEVILLDVHEGMGIVESTNWYRLYGGQATIESYPESSIYDYHKSWMNSLQHYFDLGDYYLVHAGLNFRGGAPLADETSMLWIRNWYEDIQEQYLGGRTIVHGHTPTARKDIQDMLKKSWNKPVINIDGGCYADQPGLGHLCALNLDYRELIFEKR